VVVEAVRRYCTPSFPDPILSQQAEDKVKRLSIKYKTLEDAAVAELKSLAEAKAERDSILAERDALQAEVAEKNARAMDRRHDTERDARFTPAADFVVVSLHNSNLQHFVRNSAIREVVKPLFLTLRARFKCPIFLLGDYNATKVALLSINEGLAHYKY
jgi:hypothetical protein